MARYKAADWYWVLSGDEDNVFASGRAQTVPFGDAAYEAWLADGNLATRVGFTAGLSKAEAYAELYDVLEVQAPTVAAAVVAEWAAAGYLSAARQAAVALSAPLAVNSSGTPAVNGAYAIDPATQGKIASISSYILVNGKFPGGIAGYPWPDANGAFHTFPSTGLFQAWATAIADYVSALDMIVAVGGGTLPEATVTIA